MLLKSLMRKTLGVKRHVVELVCFGFRTVLTYVSALYHGLGKLPELALMHRFYAQILVRSHLY